MKARFPLGELLPLPLHRFLTYTCAMVAIALTTGPGVLSASNPYDGYPTRGLAVYKTSLFASDSTARITEYLGYKSHETVTYLVTPDGGRLTIPTRTSDLLILPYPGRGELHPEAALLIISVAESRFPQYRRILAPLKSAWVEESKRPSAQIAEEIRKRQEQQTVAQKVVNLWNSVTQASHKRPATPVPSPTPAEKQKVKSKPVPAELEKNLQIIKEYYQTLDKIANEPSQ